MTDNHTNGWPEYQRLVLAKLDELSSDVKEIQATQARQNQDIAVLKVKSGLWGGAAGLIPFGLWVAYALIQGN